jgi:hypothetical protein
MIPLLLAMAMMQAPSVPTGCVNCEELKEKYAKPLTCPKYQHLVHSGAESCRPAPECVGKGMSCNIAICTPEPPDRCEDTMHTVTEKEWVDLMERLKALEKRLPPCNYDEGCLTNLNTVK